MPATAITPIDSTKVNVFPHKAVEGAFAASDANNGNSFANTGRQVLLVTTDSSDRTITFTDRRGRTVGTAVALKKEKTYAFGPFKVYEYGSTLAFKTSNAAVEVAVFTLADLD